MGTSGAGMLVLVVVFLLATRVLPESRKFLNGYHEAQLRRERTRNETGRKAGTNGPDDPDLG